VFEGILIIHGEGEAFLPHWADNANRFRLVLIATTRGEEINIRMLMT